MSNLEEEIHDREKCCICKKILKDNDSTAQIRQKGADSINAASVQRGDNISVLAGSKVHLDCRKKYINQHDIAIQRKKVDTSDVSLKRSARMSTGVFDSKSDCLFCGTLVIIEASDYSYVKTDCFARTILDCCESRCDDWSFTVRGRIEYYGGDLHAADCIYHHACSVNFRNGYDIPVQFGGIADAKRRKSGKPKDDDQDQAFKRMCSYLERSDHEQLTISFLQDMMKEFLSREDSVPYSKYYLKTLLKERYGNSIFISEVKGFSDIVTFRETTSHILHSYHTNAQREGDMEEQKKIIIETAARLIKSDIKTNVQSVSDYYPKSEELLLGSAVGFLPDALRNMLNLMFVGNDVQHKVAAIGHAIVQAVRPRAVITPLQIGLAIQVYHLYHSRFLVDILHALGFSSSYAEVLRFERNAANANSPDSLLDDTAGANVSVLFSGDNVDHNLLTIDGKGTFHGMGMIAALTPGKRKAHIVNRHNVSEINIAETTKVDIIEYRFVTHALHSIKFEKIACLRDCSMRVDILWELSLSFKEPVPNWQGMMHILHQGYAHPGKASIVYLPMIDMYSGDKTCILSTLEYISNLASRHNIPPVITFDQPIYWKAAEIISAAPQNSHLKQIVLMLGSFHTFMNLLGAIGTLMEGTGLKNILEAVYGENAVVHMLTGKSIERAFRGHLLVDKCLNQMVVKFIINETPEFASQVEEAEQIYLSLLKGDMTLESLESSTMLSEINDKLNQKKAELSVQSKTSQLWLGYQRMLSVARALIKADRTGSWLNHLCAVSEALPIFAAAGHYNYLKSAYFYIQEMNELENRNTAVYQKFQMGLYVSRRTNQYWAGLGSDLVIEQTLMRSLKSAGGLTHGSKMTEEKRALWTMSAPIMSEFNSAMQEFSGLTYTTSEQHKVSSRARIKRDTSDLSKISTKLKYFSPFTSDPSLRNVINGTVAKEETNVHEYESVGQNIINKMAGQPVFSISFKRKDKAKTLGSLTSVKVTQDRTIDSNLLFQRFLVVSRTGELSLEDVMRYELSPYPPSLFESKHVLRKPDKPQLAQAIEEHCKKLESCEAISDFIPKTDRYVLDGGSLLHRLKWNNGDTYGKIAKSYATFTTKHYGEAAVVFDGYRAGPSVKDGTHQRRRRNIKCPVISFTDETEFVGKKEEFLSVDSNKQQLIDLITEELRNESCQVIQAEGDADVDIAKTAVNMAHAYSTTLIGEDTDLLILLLHYSIVDDKPLYFRSDNQSRGATKVYSINCIKRLLGTELCTHILFVHAFTGCDSTSRVYGIGKKSLFCKVVEGDPIVRSCAEEFTTQGKNRSDIGNVGSQVMAVIFGGNSTCSLSALRYDIFARKVAGAKSFVTPERLPPTESSTKFHCLRVYFQVMSWMEKDNDISPLDWGWTREDNQLVPIMSDMMPAPDALLKMVHCNCMTGCSTPRCSCRKYGFSCSSVCGSCQLTSCENMWSQVYEEEESVDGESGTLNDEPVLLGH